MVDPIAHAVLDAAEPWDAYNAAETGRAALTEYLEWGPHGGAVYIAWAELADVYETGKTPIIDAHATLRKAATSWLDRSGLPSGSFIEGWISDANEAVRTLFERDGDFWRSPS